ncbi:MAG: ABC transporter ATP-binding protein [bacterium]
MKIKIKDVDFSYNSVHILKKVSLNVHSGEVLSIVGPNGAGKSTLLKCMVRLLKLDDGSVYLNGEDIFKMDSKELAKAMGYVPQTSRDIFPFTVMETVLMGRKPHLKWDVNAEDLQIVDKMMRYMHVDHLAERSIDQLSGGQKQKVFVARALAQQPDVFLFDEPTSSLDIRHQLEVFETIHRLAKDEGRTIVVVVHDLNLAARFSERLVMLKNGEIFAAGTPEEVITKEHIRQVYQVEAEIMNSKFGPYIWPIRSLAED